MIFKKIQLLPFYPWIACVSASLFFTYTLLQMTLLNVISLDVMETLQINAKQFSSLEIVYLVASAIFFIPTGLALDIFSVRRLILIGFCLSIFGTILFGISSSLVVLQVGRFLTGIGYSVSLLGCFRLIVAWLPKQITFAFGISTTLGLLGTLIAQTPLTMLVRLVGWQQAMLFDAVLGILILFIVWFLVHDHPADKLRQLGGSKISLLSSLTRACFCYKNWLCAAYACLLNTPILFLGALWGGMYLVQAQALTKEQASYVTSLLFLGLMLGCTLIGWLAQFFSKKLLMTVSSLLLLILTIPLCSTKVFSVTTLLVLYFFYGFIASTQTLIYSIVAQQNAKIIIGIASGFVSSLAMLGNAVLQRLFAEILSYGWDKTTIHDVPLYSLENHVHAVSIIPIFALLSLLIAIVLHKASKIL